MCTVVLLTVPMGTDLERVGSALGCAVDEVAAPGLRRRLAARGVLPVVRKRTCDCGTQLGVRAAGDDPKAAGAPPQSLEGDRARLLRKGWSEAKIARWLGDRRRAEERRRRDQHTHHERGEGTADWLSRLARLRAEGVHQVGIQLTDQDALAVDAALPERVVRHRLEGTDGDALAELEPGVLHLFE